MFFDEIGGVFPSISSIFCANSCLRGISPLILITYFLAILEVSEIGK
jgi:hypothetical protein